MTAVTPGQAFRDALRERWVARGRCVDTRDYASLPQEDRDDLEFATQSAIDHYNDNRTSWPDEGDLAEIATRAAEQEQAAPVGEQPEPELERLRRMLAKATKERDLLFGSMRLGEAKAVVSGRELRDVVLDEPQPAPELATVTAERDRYRDALAAISAMCAHPKAVAGMSHGLVVNGEHLAAAISRVIDELEAR